MSTGISSCFICYVFFSAFQTFRSSIFKSWHLSVFPVLEGYVLIIRYRKVNNLTLSHWLANTNYIWSPVLYNMCLSIWKLKSQGLFIRIYQLSLHFSDTSYIGTSTRRSQTCHDVRQNWTHTHNVYYTFCLLIIEPIYCSIGCLLNWVFDCINSQSLFLSCTQKKFCFTF